MTTATPTVFVTRFGKYVPCDRETYRKLKRINHLIEQRVIPFARRWRRAQARLPKNRVFRIWNPEEGKKVPVLAKDSWVFDGLFERYAQTRREYGFTRPNARYEAFTASYNAARRPVDTPEEVKPIDMTPEQVDQLLFELEAWYSTGV